MAEGVPDGAKLTRGLPEPLGKKASPEEFISE